MLQGSVKKEAPTGHSNGANGKTKSVNWGDAHIALRNVTVVGKSSAVEVMVTPALAAAWLALNTNNRGIIKRQVATFVRDIKADRWFANSRDPIMIGSNGVVLNGQHRLAAVVEAGKTVRMLVEFGADPSIVPAIDRGKGRSPLDSFVMSSGKSKSRFWGGVGTAAMQGACGTQIVSTTQDSERFYNDHERAIDYAAEHFEGARRGIKRAPLAAVIARAYGNVPKNKLDEFCEVLTSGVATLKGHAIIMTLRDWLLTHPAQGGSSSRVVTYRKAARALLAFVNGEKIKTLYEVAEEPWPYPGERRETKLKHKRAKERRR